MAEPLESMKALKDELDALNAQITKQGSMVRQLKKDGAAEQVGPAVEKLQALKVQAAALDSQLAKPEFNRKSFDDLVLRKMFVVPSFEIHGGVKGLFDLGPPGCAVKASMIDLWRKHFVLNESMLEMDCTNLTPHCVLKTSGHVDRFTDLMVKDGADCFRADKLLEDAIDELLENNPTMPLEEKEEHLRVQRQADAYSPAELDELLKKYDCKGPSGNPYSASFPFNLMFQTSIGPEGTSVGYLRPETAQGLFCNFRRLLDYNAGRMPFAAAQIGLGFRNEIAPRSGLLRVREFCMGEIEHFVNPKNKKHANFASVADKELVLFGHVDQLGSGKTITLAIGKAVEQGLVNNETLGYFMARTQLYMEKIGMDPSRLRFRQHLETEMAHYAADCWDLEIESSYGWVECVGHADRACYDLQVHAKETKTALFATEKVDPPVEIEYAKLKFDRKELGKCFKQDQRIVSGLLETMAENWADFEPTAIALETEGKITLDGFEVTKEMVSWTKSKKMVHEIKFVPSVIEPSFGIGRILYSLLEHSFYQRDGDEQRTVMRFKPAIAPNKCAVFPISSNSGCGDMVDEIAASLMDMDLSTRVDKSSSALGRRYARADELGVPFAVTVDFESIKDNSVTLRERDSMKQVRLPKDGIPMLIFEIVHGRKTWDDVLKKYPVVESADEEGAGEPKSSDPTTVVSTSRTSFRRPTESIAIALYYCYTNILDPNEHETLHRTLCEQRNLLGRIRVATEGLNGVLSGKMNDLQVYVATIEEELGRSLDVKYGPLRSDRSVESQLFTSLSIRVTQQVVSLADDEIMKEALLEAEAGERRITAEHLDAKEWTENLKSVQEDDNVILLDCRNVYESNVGRFEVKNASTLLTNTRQFADLPAVLESRKDELAKASKIYAYCTGGVRCERATLYLHKLLGDGPKIYQLHGGIQRYLEQDSFEDSVQFKGKNFVFDPRRTDPQVQSKDVVGKCTYCEDSFDDYDWEDSPVRCKSCRILLLVCPSCRSSETFCGKSSCIGIPAPTLIKG